MLKPVYIFIFFNIFVILCLCSPVLQAPASASSTAYDELDYIGAFGTGEPVIDVTAVPSIRHGSRGMKQIALTFDDGPFRYTSEILDTLKKYDVKATFFLVGIQVEKFPELANRIAKEGHEIGNHSYSHKYLTQVDTSTWKDQVDRCTSLIKATTGVTPKLFRPPYNKYNDDIQTYVNNAGMTLVQYDVDPSDWKKISSATVKQRILTNAEPGAIILMHDLSSATRGALGEIVESLRAEGYTFVTVGEMVAEISGDTKPAESRLEG